MLARPEFEWLKNEKEVKEFLDWSSEDINWYTLVTELKKWRENPMFAKYKENIDTIISSLYNL